jgi:hypothetical protein
MEIGMGMGRALDAASSMASRTSLDVLAVEVEDRSWGAPRERESTSRGCGKGIGVGVCLFVFISGSSGRELLSTGEGGRGTCVGARARGIIWPGASGGGVGSSVVRSARRAAGGMTSAGW